MPLRFITTLMYRLAPVSISSGRPAITRERSGCQAAGRIVTVSTSRIATIASIIAAGTTDGAKRAGSVNRASCVSQARSNLHPDVPASGCFIYAGKDSFLLALRPFAALGFVQLFPASGVIRGRLTDIPGKRIQTGITEAASPCFLSTGTTRRFYKCALCAYHFWFYCWLFPWR